GADGGEQARAQLVVEVLGEEELGGGGEPPPHVRGEVRRVSGVKTAEDEAVAGVIPETRDGAHRDGLSGLPARPAVRTCYGLRRELVKAFGMETENRDIVKRLRTSRSRERYASGASPSCCRARSTGISRPVIIRNCPKAWERRTSRPSTARAPCA